MSAFLRPKELARELGLTTAALEKWRRKGRGPRFHRLGSPRVVAYARADVDAWLAEQRVSRPARPNAA